MKTPSNELASLITQTVETYFTIRRLWSKVLDKGQKEGFTGHREALKDMLTLHQIRYLFRREEMNDVSKKQYDNLHNITQIDNDNDNKIPTEFYEELDTFALIEKESKALLSTQERTCR